MDFIFSMGQLLISNLWLIVLGVLVGILVGAIPGFSAANTLIMLLPLTISMEIHSALFFMAAVYAGANSGGSVPAILVQTPGTGGSVATTFDGYPMAQKGLAQQALVIALVASSIGGSFASVIALFATPFLANFALQFKNVEMFIVILFGIVLIAQISGKNLAKGLIAGFFGLLLGAVGFDQMWDIPRGTFGVLELYEGMPKLAALIGMFAISECMFMVNKKSITGKSEMIKTSWEGTKEGILMTVRDRVGLIRSAIIGLLVGILPGAGASIGSMVSYQQARNFSKHPERFGTGIPEGVVASEAANSSVTAGALIPLFTLGIPGSTTTMVMLVVLQAHGLPIGPRLFETAAPLAYSVLLAMLVGSLLMGVIGIPITYKLSKITVIPTSILAPVIVSITVVGAFVGRGYYVDILIAFIFGCIGYLMKKTGYPPHATVLGLILGPMAEGYFLRAMRISGNSITTFFSSPIAVVLWILLLISVFGPSIYRIFKSNFPNRHLDT